MLPHAAHAGAITNVVPASPEAGLSLDLDSGQNGPSIIVAPLPAEPGQTDTESLFAPNADPNQGDLQQSYVPWIVQDRESLDWFGKRDDLLSVDAGTANSSPSQSIAVLDQPVQPSGGQGGDQIQSYSSSRAKVGEDKNLDVTLTKLVAGFFQSLGYVKTIAVLVPVVLIGIFIALMQLAKILRVSQGLDPEQGRRWGFKRSGQFGQVDETNDNVARPRSRRDVA